MNYQNNYEDECFVATTVEEYHEQLTEEQLFLNDQIRNSLPQANQLKPYYRPTTMAARVMSIQPDITKLPSVLNQPCEEQSIEVDVNSSNSRPKLNNKEKLGLAEYLEKKQFQLVYSKALLNGAGKSISQMTIRLRQISQVSDFNQKAFKEIGQYEDYLHIASKLQSIDSNFECGNLSRAYINQNHENAFYLLLEQDTNTHGYTNWFFFRFRNKQKSVKKFYILNMVKRTSFYKQGMKISVFSIKKWQQNQIKWYKSGNNISFFQTSFNRQQHNDCFNCLYFQYEFQYEDDEVYFAASQPYTYTRMAELIKSTTQSQQSKQIYNCRSQIIGYSISNNIIPSITFSMGSQQVNKKTIVILGRQHPSEMAGSFISQSLIKLLKCPKQNQQIQFLLKKFNIMIIPMVNPDGVIYGNSRSNLCGFDLNRHWGADSIKQLTPQTHKIRSALCQLEKSNHHIKFLLDLHGHGKKLNSFLFCCRKQDRISNRYFSLIMSKLEQRFDIASCTYGISRDKQNTVRAQLYDIGIRDCYTLQNSYYGYNKNKQKMQVISYKQSDYQAIAKSIIKSLFVFFSDEKNQKDIVKQKIGWNMDNINEELIKIVDKLERQEKINIYDQDIMSESDPEGDGLKLEERLNMCTNSKVLGRKIRQSFKKTKPVQRSSKTSKRSRFDKLKTQPVEQQKQPEQQQDIRILQKKIQGKLILSKKLRTHNKIKTSMRERKSMLQTKRPTEQDEQKVVKKILNKPFNPFKIPSQQPTTKMSSSLYSQNINNSATKTKAYDKCRIYEKLKTEITESHCFSALDIQTQNQRKQKIQTQLQKLKQQNLKNVVKQSLLFMGSSLKSKKCRWVDDRKQKNLASNHLIEAKINSFSVNLDNLEEQLPLKPQKSEVLIGKNQKIIIRPASDSLQVKVYSESKRERPKRSYQRFESFVKNTPSIHKLLNENKGPVFYHFPVM